MAQRTVTYTHKGWLGLCPVVIGMPDSEGPDIDTRFPFTDWLLDISIIANDAFTPLEEYGWPIKITGKLAEPITRVHETE